MSATPGSKPTSQMTASPSLWGEVCLLLPLHPTSREEERITGRKVRKTQRGRVQWATGERLAKSYFAEAQIMRQRGSRARAKQIGNNAGTWTPSFSRALDLASSIPDHCQLSGASACWPAPDVGVWKFKKLLQNRHFEHSRRYHLRVTTLILWYSSALWPETHDRSHGLPVTRPPFGSMLSGHGHRRRVAHYSTCTDTPAQRGRSSEGSEVSRGQRHDAARLRPFCMGAQVPRHHRSLSQ
jgi:hypothetical protein